LATLDATMVSRTTSLVKQKGEAAKADLRAETSVMTAQDALGAAARSLPDAAAAPRELRGRRYGGSGVLGDAVVAERLGRAVHAAGEPVPEAQ
jgi:hypothetical protein